MSPLCINPDLNFDQQYHCSYCMKYNKTRLCVSKEINGFSEFLMTFFHPNTCLSTWVNVFCEHFPAFGIVSIDALKSLSCHYNLSWSSAFNLEHIQISSSCKKLKQIFSWQRWKIIFVKKKKLLVVSKITGIWHSTAKIYDKMWKNIPFSIERNTRNATPRLSSATPRCLTYPKSPTKKRAITISFTLATDNTKMYMWKSSIL